MPSRLLAVLLLLSLGLAALASQQRVTETELSVSFQRPPDTIGEMLSQADAVVIAVHASTRPAVFTFAGGGRELPSTLHEFVVLDVVRVHPILPIPGGELTLEALGGDRERSDHVERLTVRGLRPFVSGRTYVLFLRWLAERGRWDVAWGAPWAVYDVTAATVRSLSVIPGPHDGRPVSELLAELGVREISPAPR
jgi:hypothetical protein